MSEGTVLLDGDFVKVTAVPAEKFDVFVEEMNHGMRQWTDQAARGECPWVCSDCCCSDVKGMPDACFHGNAWCTRIIQRDKREAMKTGNEPS
ncbi:MAG: hypothetical protein WC052_05745 [Patescibacteria group bacterium]